VKILGLGEGPLVKDYTKSNEAYELFLKGLFFQNKGQLGWNKAKDYYEKSIQSKQVGLPPFYLIGKGSAGYISRFDPNWNAS